MKKQAEMFWQQHRVESVIIGIGFAAGIEGSLILIGNELERNIHLDFPNYFELHSEFLPPLQVRPFFEYRHTDPNLPAPVIGGGVEIRW